MLFRKFLSVAKDQQQKGPDGQEPELNEIQPGMEVEDTDHDLGESDVSKPRVAKVIRDEQGQVEDVVVNKGVIFRKQVEVPADRIEKVEQDGKEGRVVIETVAE